MRHVTLTTFAVATALVAIVACEQQAPDRNPTAPDGGALFAKAMGDQCDGARLRLIATQQANLWAKPYLTDAKALFDPVVTNCANDAGKNYMLAYIQWTIDHKANIIAQDTATPEKNLIIHWSTVFPYVGYTGLSAPSVTSVNTSIFSDSGAARVIPNPDSLNPVELATPASSAALTMYHQNATTGDPRTHLFVIYPLGTNCLTGSNLHQFGPCYEFASFPKVSPKFEQPIKVGVCQPLNHDDSLSKHFGAPGLGHFKTEGSNTFVEIPGQIAYPTFCSHLDNITDAGSWSGGIAGISKRLAWMTKRAFGVQPLYAVHGGLGGLGGGISPFGGVNLEVFRATFSNETVGSRPTTPEVGAWDTISVTAPGTITVQSFLGATTTGNVVVLNQAGGACAKCGGLILRGKLTVEPGNPPAHNGLYEASFIALQDNANMKRASFLMRDSGKRVLANVTYDVKSNVNRILFNGQDTGIPWVRHIPITFTIRLNLDTHQAKLFMNGDPVFGGADIPFVDGTSTTDFTYVAADFAGIDSGVMGWDEIRVVRLSDN